MAETRTGERRAADTERDTEPGTGQDTGPDTGHTTGPDTERNTGTDTERISERSTEPGTAPGTEPGTEPGTAPGTEPGTAQWSRRPPYSYAALITMAIRASPKQRLPLSSIYAYITERFPFYRATSRYWQNSIRHNLSLNPCFRRLPRRYGRAGDWEVHPAFQDMFPEGNYLLRRRHGRRPPRAAPPSGLLPGPAAPRASPPSGMGGMASLPAALWPPPPSGMGGMASLPTTRWPPPPSGIPPGRAEPPLLPEPLPGPPALWPPPPCAVPPVPSGCPPGPWAALLLSPGYPELPAQGPSVPPGLPPPAGERSWALRPAELDTALTCDLGTARLTPAFR